MSRPQQSKEVGFQVAWTLLHLMGAAMNLGSAIYHIRRIWKEDDAPPPSSSYKA